MTDLDEKIIAISKGKVLGLVVIFVLCGALGVWMLTLDPEMIESQQRFNSPTLVYGIAVAMIPIFLFCLVVTVPKLFGNKPALVLNSAGVIDNSSTVSAGLIPWSEIQGIDALVVQGQKLLIIKVHNPQSFIEGAPRLKRSIHNSNQQSYGSPIVISARTLAIPFTELITSFEHYQEKYGRI